MSLKNEERPDKNKSPEIPWSKIELTALIKSGIFFLLIKLTISKNASKPIEFRFSRTICDDIFLLIPTTLSNSWSASLIAPSHLLAISFNASSSY